MIAIWGHPGLMSLLSKDLCEFGSKKGGPEDDRWAAIFVKRRMHPLGRDCTNHLYHLSWNAAMSELNLIRAIAISDCALIQLKDNRGCAKSARRPDATARICAAKEDQGETFACHHIASALPRRLGSNLLGATPRTWYVDALTS